MKAKVCEYDGLFAEETLLYGPTWPSDITNMFAGMSEVEMARKLLDILCYMEHRVRGVVQARQLLSKTFRTLFSNVTL